MFFSRKTGVPTIIEEESSPAKYQRSKNKNKEQIGKVKCTEIERPNIYSSTKILATLCSSMGEIFL